MEAVSAAFQLDVAPPALDTPPNLEMGDISVAACFELAKQLRQAPARLPNNSYRIFPPGKKWSALALPEQDI